MHDHASTIRFCGWLYSDSSHCRSRVREPDIRILKGKNADMPATRLDVNVDVCVGLKVDELHFQRLKFLPWLLACRQHGHHTDHTFHILSSFSCASHQGVTLLNEGETRCIIPLRRGSTAALFSIPFSF